MILQELTSTAAYQDATVPLMTAVLKFRQVKSIVSDQFLSLISPSRALTEAWEMLVRERGLQRHDYLHSVVQKLYYCKCCVT